MSIKYRRFSNRRRKKNNRKINKRRRSKKRIKIKKLPPILRKRSRKTADERKLILKTVKFVKGTKVPNYKHKESRLMTISQKKLYLSKCVADPYRFLNDSD